MRIIGHIFVVIFCYKVLLGAMKQNLLLAALCSHICFNCLKSSITHTLHHLSFKIGNWDRGTPLEKVVEAVSELGVPGLLQVSTCWDELDDLDVDG